MPAKRFSLVDMEAKGNLTKRQRPDNVGSGAELIAVARPWGSAFWVFEGGPTCRNRNCFIYPNILSPDITIILYHHMYPEY